MNKILTIINITLLVYILFLKPATANTDNYWLQQIFYKLVNIERALTK